MIRSMYSAISGLRNHQTMMDVVGNNIANVNTTGYKGSNTVFHDVLSQTLQGATGPATLGGTNPAQVGLGSRLAGINTDFSQGSLQRSGRITDMAIQGDGFFVVDQGGAQVFSRAGNFSLDANGNLATTEGGLVQGWQADGFGNIDSNGAIGPLKVPVGQLVPPTGTANINLDGNLPAADAVGTAVTTASKIYDTQGNAVILNFTFTKTAANQWTATASYGSPATNVALTNNVLAFDATGTLTSGASMGIAAGAIPQMTAMSVNMGGTGTTGQVSQYGSANSLLARTQDGASAGSLQSFSMGQDGTIMGTYTNGQTRAIAQVALANFANPQGLEKIGNSQFRITANSGAPEIGVAGLGGKGLLVQGALEQSNVDLAQEFTSLIMAQRGFQANGRVITTSDEMLQEVVNLKR